MQGLHVFDPRAVVAVDLESLVHQDHFLRKVDRILETAFIRELTAACYASRVGQVRNIAHPMRHLGEHSAGGAPMPASVCRVRLRPRH